MEAATEKPVQHVAIFGLSGDPPTRAHAAIVAHVAALVDELWVLPVYRCAALWAARGGVHIT